MSKKLLLIVMLALAVALIAACAPAPTPAPTPAPPTAAPAAKPTDAPKAAGVMFGVILVGPYNDHGWSEAHYQGAQYVKSKLPGSDFIYLDKLNPAGGATKTRKKGDGEKKQRKQKKARKAAAQTPGEAQ